METTTPIIEPPLPATLKKYGFGTAERWADAEGMTPAEADWSWLLASQGAACGVCERVPNPNKRTGKVRLVVDHEHVRGWKTMPPEQRRLYVRGLVCWVCNHYYLGRGITVAIAGGVLRYLTNYASRRPE
jgi:hypothetical protein